MIKRMRAALVVADTVLLEYFLMATLLRMGVSAFFHADVFSIGSLDSLLSIAPSGQFVALITTLPVVIWCIAYSTYRVQMRMIANLMAAGVFIAYTVSGFLAGGVGDPVFDANLLLTVFAVFVYRRFVKVTDDLL